MLIHIHLLIIYIMLTKYYRMTAKKIKKIFKKKIRFERYRNLNDCLLSKKIASTAFLLPRQLQQDDY